ncbi:MAG: MarR family transcriptional regulator [Planctomycetes bacterium]|nr:MarR family transcriptional regulator [Planctomycetota bacterium]
MANKLAHEIRQSKPFASLEQEAYLNLQRTAAVLERALEETLKPHGISATQYNALRILRGAGPNGLSCQEVGARMIRFEPDLTRLFDRLEARGLIGRTRSEEDRRVVLVRIAPPGTKLLASLDDVVEGLHKKPLVPMGEKKLRQLIDLCEELRNFA